MVKASGIDKDGRVYFDDLYLDVVLLPTGETLLLDEDELLDALNKGDINQADYEMAYKQARDIIDYVCMYIGKITDFSNAYLAKLKDNIMKNK